MVGASVSNHIRSLILIVSSILADVQLPGAVFLLLLLLLCPNVLAVRDLFVLVLLALRFTT